MTNFYPMILGLSKVYVKRTYGWKCIEKPYKMVLLRDAMTIYAENGTDTLPADTPIYTSIENGEKDIEVADGCIYVDIAGEESVVLSESCGVYGAIPEDGEDKIEKLFVKKNGCFEEFDIKEWAYNTSLTITLDENRKYVLSWDDNIEIYPESLVKQLKEEEEMKQDMKESRDYPYILGLDRVFMKIDANNFKELIKPHKVVLNPDNFTVYSEGGVNTFEYGTEAFKTLEDAHDKNPIEMAGATMYLVNGDWVDIEETEGCSGVVCNEKTEKLYKRNQDGSFTPFNFKEWAKGKTVTVTADWRRMAIETWSEKVDIYPESLVEHFRVINVEKDNGVKYQEKGMLAKLELTDKQREVVERLNEVMREVEENHIQLWCTPNDSYDVRAINISEVRFLYPEESEENNMRITDLPEKWWDIKGMTEKVEEFRVDFLDNKDFVVATE